MRHTAQQFTPRDFARFDLVLAMDDENRRNLLAIAPDDHAAGKVAMLLRYDALSEPGAAVPDPYYGGPEGFAQVFDLVERACRGLLDELVP
jgi:protein-tyrosine phosphatase